MNFQRANGLAVDGSFGPASYRKMNNILSGNSGQLIYNRALRLGLSGRDVNDLQEALKSLGYLVINKTTDYFGTMTQQALMNFQRANGLAVDGSFGPASHRKMNDILADNSGSSDPNKGDENRKSLTTNIIATAKKYIGVPYVFGGSTTSGFDCSGYTQFVYRQYGINIPRTSIDQSKVGN